MHGLFVLLQLGSRRVFVVSSSSIAEECFTKNDVFANRPRLLIAKHLGCNYTIFFGHPPVTTGETLSIEVLSAYRLQMHSAMHLEEIRWMICRLFRNQN
ncbi:hypothetical protein OIU76_007467 [Salix suchowensis]|nr:hypothetical protein OIU76_007467 [Salix suchowensis]